MGEKKTLLRSFPIAHWWNETEDNDLVLVYQYRIPGILHRGYILQSFLITEYTKLFPEGLPESSSGNPRLAVGGIGTLHPPHGGVGADLPPVK